MPVLRSIFFTDSKIIKDTYYKGLSRARFAANSDLWLELFTICTDKHLLLHLYWMPSHTKDNPAKKAKAPAWMTDWHVKGNDKADGNADTGAALHTIPRDTADPLINVLTTLNLLQERHLAVAKLLPQRERNATKSDDYRPTRSIKIDLACQQSSHNCI